MNASSGNYLYAIGPGKTCCVKLAHSDKTTFSVLLFKNASGFTKPDWQLHDFMIPHVCVEIVISQETDDYTTLPG